MGSIPTVLAPKQEKNQNDTCYEDNKSRSHKENNSDTYPRDNESCSDSKSCNDDKCNKSNLNEKQRFGILEYHGYTSGRFIGSGSFATVEVIVTIFSDGKT